MNLGTQMSKLGVGDLGCFFDVLMGWEEEIGAIIYVKERVDIKMKAFAVEFLSKESAKGCSMSGKWKSLRDLRWVLLQLVHGSPAWQTGRGQGLFYCAVQRTSWCGCMTKPLEHPTWPTSHDVQYMCNIWEGGNWLYQAKKMVMITCAVFYA